MIELSIRDYMVTDYPFIDKNETLYHAFKIMEKYGFDKAVIYEHKVDSSGHEYKALAGILTCRDIVSKLATQRLRLTTPGRLHVSSFMSFNPVYAPIDTPIESIARTMYEKRIGIIPVLEDHSVVGVVLREKILDLLRNDDREVRHIMNTEPLVVRTSDRLLKVKQDMLASDSSYAVVLDERNDIIGYITIVELAYAFFKFQDIVPAKHKKERIMHLIVEDVMRHRPVKLRITDTVATAYSSIMERGCRGVVVVDEIGGLAGVITVHDLLEYLVREKLSIR